MIIRVNNIGVEAAQPERASLSSYDSLVLSIVKYHPNKYYNLMEEYIEAGWVEDGSHICKNNIRLKREIFSKPECFSVLAFVYLDPSGECTRLESVSDRMLRLSPSDRSDFFEAYRLADREVMKTALISEVAR